MMETKEVAYEKMAMKDAIGQYEEMEVYLIDARCKLNMLKRDPAVKVYLAIRDGERGNFDYTAWAAIKVPIHCGHTTLHWVGW